MKQEISNVESKIVADYRDLMKMEDVCPTIYTGTESRGDGDFYYYLNRSQKDRIYLFAMPSVKRKNQNKRTC